MIRGSKLSPLDYFRTNSIVPPILEPISTCVVVASFVGSIAIALSGKKDEQYAIACWFFVGASISSLFGICALRKKRNTAIKALFGAILCLGGALWFFAGLLLLLVGYDGKSARTLVFGTAILSIAYFILVLIESRVERRFRDSSERSHVGGGKPPRCLDDQAT